MKRAAKLRIPVPGPTASKPRIAPTRPGKGNAFHARTDDPKDGRTCCTDMPI